MFVHVCAHEFSETVVGVVVVWGGETCVPCWFRERDELARLVWRERSRTSPNISVAVLLSEAVIAFCGDGAAVVPESLGRGGEYCFSTALAAGAEVVDVPDPIVPTLSPEEYFFKTFSL